MWVKLKDPNLKDLEENLRGDFPHSILMHTAVTLNLMFRPERYKIDYYITEGFDERSAKMVMFDMTLDEGDINIQFLLLYAEKKYSEPMSTKVLRSIGDITGDRVLLLSGTPEFLWPEIEKINAEMWRTRIDECYIYVLEDEKDLQCEYEAASSEILEVRALTEDHLKEVLEYWTYGDELGASVWLKDFLKLGLVYGTFCEGELASWICTAPYGCMAHLFTKDKFRKRGCASLCTIRLSKHLVSLGITPCVYIDRPNQASQTFFSKLGFKKAYKTGFLVA